MIRDMLIKGKQHRQQSTIPSRRRKYWKLQSLIEITGCVYIFMQSDFVIKKEIFVRLRTQPFEKIYQIHPKTLGSGSSAQVFKARQRDHPKQAWRAVKVYTKKNDAIRKQMLNQLNILKRLDHPTIIKVHEVFENTDKIYVVQDYCQGGDLFERLSKEGGFSEYDARRIFRQLLETVNYCHMHKVAHRDLKPENVLLLKKQGLEAKLIDFGCAFEWETSMEVELSQLSNKNLVGSVYYVSPDILTNNNHYDQRTDLWSLGVILYVLITGIAPFDGRTQEDIFDAIIHYKYSLSVPEMKAVSPQLKDLIKKILVQEKDRLTVTQIFAHPWMTSEPNRIPIRINTTGLTAFSKFTKTKRLTANFLASRASPAQVEQLTRLFQQMDVNRDGELSYDELKRGLEREGLKGLEINAFIQCMDADHNGIVNYSQFLAAFAGESQFTDDGIRRAFEMLDSDGNGLVSKEQLLSLFAESGMNTLNGKTAEAILEQCDHDKNGVIDYEQFRACLRTKP